jgi:uncharacterized heparinase superfamily protein
MNPNTPAVTMAPASLAGLVDFGARSLAARTSRKLAAVWRVPATCKATGLGIPILPLIRANPDLAADIYRGRFAFADTVIECKGHVIFDHVVPDPAWLAGLHGFSWLSAMREANRDLFRVHARALLSDWIERSANLPAIAWRTDTVARRLICWSQQAGFAIDGAAADFQQAFLRAITQHVRTLNRQVASESNTMNRLQAAIAIVYACHGFSGLESLLQSAHDRLSSELETQILPDGGHVSRNPAVLLDLLLDLMPLRQALQSHHLEVPIELNSAIERMVPMLRFFCHDDGGLAVFNGVNRTMPGAARTVMDSDTTLGRPLSHAVHSGYAQVSRGASKLIMDVGRPPAPGLNTGASSDPLAIEFSDGPHRIVVNCGAPATPGSGWDQVARKTAAHSTVCLDDRSAGLILADRLTRSVFGTPAVIGPGEIGAKLEHDKQGSMIDAGHDGYLMDYGVLHQRRLFLSACGCDLRGEDRFIADLENPGNLVSVPFAARFHLHPAVKATLSMDASSVVLMLPSKTGWRFSARGGRLKLEDSIYLPGAGGTRKTKQIVVEGVTGRPDRIQWAFKKIAKRKATPASNATATPQLPL